MYGGLTSELSRDEERYAYDTIPPFSEGVTYKEAFGSRGFRIEGLLRSRVFFFSVQVAGLLGPWIPAMLAVVGGRSRRR